MIYENGASKGTHGGLSPGDVIEIKRVGINITYYVNGVLRYTSLNTSAVALDFDSSLYRNIRVDNISISY